MPDADRGSTASLTAAVVGTSERAVTPVAAAVAAELRYRERASAAVVALWRPGAPSRAPSGAATPAARRLAARVSADERSATACGRLAFVALPQDPEEAASHARQLAARAGAPVVLALSGPRAEAFEPVLAEQDAAVAVLPPDADDALRTLAFLGLPTATRLIQSPLPAGPPRWAATLGLGRLRALPPLESSWAERRHG